MLLSAIEAYARSLQPAGPSHMEEPTTADTQTRTAGLFGL